MERIRCQVTVTKCRTGETFSGTTVDDGLQSLWPVELVDGSVKYASVIDYIMWGEPA
jgi:hypothetical protein